MHNSSSAEIEKEFEHTKQFQSAVNQDSFEDFYTTSFLFEEEAEIVLKVISMYTPQQCNKAQLIEINKFSKTTLKWATNTFFTPDIIDFHCCQISFGSRENESTINAILKENALPSFDSITVLISDSLSKNLNYKVKFMQYIPWIHNEDIDVKLVVSQIGASFSLYTPPIHDNYFVILIPPGELYTSLEKLILPFDDITWMLFLLVFVVAYFVVACITISRKTQLYNLIVGENVQAPSLNIFMIFMGGGMINLPRKRFPRSIIMMFILYCLIMR